MRRKSRRRDGQLPSQKSCRVLGSYSIMGGSAERDSSSVAICGHLTPHERMSQRGDIFSSRLIFSPPLGNHVLPDGAQRRRYG